MSDYTEFESMMAQEPNTESPTKGRSFGNGNEDILSEDPVFAKHFAEQDVELVDDYDDAPDEEDVEQIFNDFVGVDMDDEFKFEDERPEEKKKSRNDDDGEDATFEQFYKDNVKFKLPNGQELNAKALIDGYLYHPHRTQEAKDRFVKTVNRCLKVQDIENTVLSLGKLLADDEIEHYENNVRWDDLSAEDFAEKDTQLKKWKSERANIKQAYDAKKQKEADEAFERDEAALIAKRDKSATILAKNFPYFDLKNCGKGSGFNMEHYGNLMTYAHFTLGVPMNDVLSCVDAGILGIWNKCFVADHGEPNYKTKVKVKAKVKQVAPKQPPKEKEFKFPWVD